MTQIELPHGGQYWYYPNYLSEEESRLLVDELMDIEWVIAKYMMYGREVPTPRRLSSMFDPQFVSADMGKVWNAETDWIQVGRKAWTPMMAILRERLQAQFGVNIIAMGKITSVGTRMMKWDPMIGSSLSRWE